MLPALRRTMAGMAARQQRMTPSVFTASTSRQRASSVSVRRPYWATPALQTSRSSGPTV